MQSAADLRSLLNRIDHRGYPAYKDTKGTYRFPGYVLSIDHVQGDPFASPSKVSIHVEGKAAAFPSDLYCGKDQRIALQDELTRQFAKKADQFAFQAKGSGKSGMIAVRPADLIRTVEISFCGWKSVFPQTEERSMRGSLRRSCFSLCRNV